MPTAAWAITSFMLAPIIALLRVAFSAPSLLLGLLLLWCIDAVAAMDTTEAKARLNSGGKQDLTIVAIPSCGLGNRMRNVNGAALMATSMNAQMEILWVETMSHCHSKFSDLFGPIASPNVKVVEIGKSSARESEKSKYGRYNSLREIPNSVYCEGYCVKYKGSLAPGCKRCPWNRTAPVYEGKAHAVVFGCGFCTYEGNSFNDKALLHHGMCAESLNMYTPPAEVQSVIKSLNIS